MRARFLRVVFGTATLAASLASSQMHKVAKPEQVVRAVGVYEWTGDFAKPTASRLIPVSIFIEGKFEDAGVYVARPVPFALLSGNLYILQDAGVDKATLDLAYARHLQAVEPTGDLAFDDGWFGYGAVRPLAAPRKPAALKPSKTLPVLTTTPDPNRPHFGSKPTDTASSNPDAAQSSTKPDTTSTDPDRPSMKRRGTPDPSATTDSGTTTSSAPSDDPDRPTMKRRTPDTTSTPTDSSAGNTPADDPDRPTMKRHTSDTASPPSSNPNDTATTTPPSSTPADDADRPTLKHHTPEEARRANLSASAPEALNNDPDRPNLHHGKAASSMTDSDLPKLSGLPPNLHQMVAVSDAVNRDPHPFALAWDDEEQHKAILEKMQALARGQLAAYSATPAPTAKSSTATAAKKTTPATAAHPHRPAAPTPPPAPLLDEELKAYALSYGGAATYVSSANTGGTGAQLRYVTIVAQADSLGEIKPAIQSVTDAAHLNRSPRMKFVDVIDADASNRASLLFELRSQSARQFALYRVIASHPDQIFLTGTTQ